MTCSNPNSSTNHAGYKSINNKFTDDVLVLVTKSFECPCLNPFFLDEASHRDEGYQGSNKVEDNREDITEVLKNRSVGLVGNVPF